MTHLFRIIELLILLAVIWIIYDQIDTRIHHLEERFLQPQPINEINMVPHSTAKIYLNGEEIDGMD